jgi:hypothetical protein
MSLVRRNELSNLKYAGRIITDTGFESTRVMKVDQNRLQDFFAVDCTWFWSSEVNQIVDGTRVSDNNQVIGLVGAYPEDPFSLAGEMTVWVDGKKNILNKSSLTLSLRAFLSDRFRSITWSIRLITLPLACVRPRMRKETHPGPATPLSPKPRRKP